MSQDSAQRAPEPAAAAAAAAAATTLKLDEFLPYRLNVCSALVTCGTSTPAAPAPMSPRKTRRPIGEPASVTQSG